MAFDEQTNEILNAEKDIVVGAILVRSEKAYESFLKLSEEWKMEMGSRLSQICNLKVLEIVDFINDQQVVLKQNLKDLDDVRVAMKCLDAIRDDSIEYHWFLKS